MENVSDYTKSLINSESEISTDKINNDVKKNEFLENELKEMTKSNDEKIEDLEIEKSDDTEKVIIKDENEESQETSIGDKPKEDNAEQNNDWDDVLGSGCLMRKILKSGIENTRPQKSDICIVNYVCTLEDGTEVENVQNGTIQLGDLEVTQGLDLALALMNTGEKCVLKIQPRLAYGSQGLDNKVPPDTTILYEIELVKVEPEEEIETLTIYQKKQMGDIKKKRGNWWYGRGECTFAIQCYRRALDYLDEVEGGIIEPKLENDDPEQRAMTDAALQDLMEDRINVSNNMAAAQMKLGAYDAALQSLQIVLRCQPNNVKALYRKSKVLREKNEVQEAMKYLQKAKELEPENTTIQKEIQELNTVLQKHKNYEKEIARRMFNSPGDKNQPKSNRSDKKTKSFMWASVALSVAVGIAGVIAWRFKFS